MSSIKYFSLGESAPDNGEAKALAVKLDEGIVEGALWSEAVWYRADYSEPAGLFKHDSDELHLFIGGDPDDPENLNAEVELWIENDKLLLKNTCAVYIPKGAAHGNMAIRGLKRPMFHYACHLNATKFAAIPAEATAAAGTYAGHSVEKYAPPNGIMPDAPEGFLTLLLFLDSQRLAGAPYMEAVWFRTENDSGPPPHTHEFDELIGFVGTDPGNPGELNGELSFSVEGEKISVTKSCLVYLPRGVRHSPILVPKMSRPFIHFSIGNYGDYVRQGAVTSSNQYKPQDNE